MIPLITREGLAFLQGICFIGVLAGIGLMVYSSRKTEQAYKLVNQSYAALIVTLIDMVENYAEVVALVDVYNNHPDHHVLSDQLVEVREEYKKVAAG